MSRKTEDVNPRFVGLDGWSSADVVDAIYEGQLASLAATRAALPAISAAVEQVADRLGDDGRLVYVGAGTSGRLAVLDGVELAPTFNWPKERLAYCLAGGEKALVVSVEGAEDDAGDGARQIEALNVGASDVVIGVAASGRTPFTVGAVERARALGALTVGIANNKDAALLLASECPILIETGSEVVAGSTRMKAGTSQKVVLNMLSTAVMVRLGRIYQGYMVDMVISNDKLHDRAIRIVAELAACGQDEAKTALKMANNDIKEAVLIALGEDQAESQNLLSEAGGNLRRALSARASE